MPIERSERVERVERITARDAEAAQRRAAGWLRARGLASGDRVAIIAQSSRAYLAAALGALRTGVVPVLLNPALVPLEQQALLEDAQPALVLRDADLPALLDGSPVDIADVPLARPMLYTSGTTGKPKGVWSGVLAEEDARALVAEERELWGFARDDVHLVVSPLHHSAPLRFATGSLLAGADVVLLGGFDVARLVRAIAEHRPTSAFVVPAHLQRLFAADREAATDLSSFRVLAHAGAPCPEALKREALRRFPAGSVWEFYGSTEGQFTACSPDEWLARPGTVGRARSGRRIDVDPDGTIWCTVPRHARFTYWRDPDKTARAWRGDAFSVFDLGRLDPDGFLFLDGRRDDLIISGGVNVYPLEVERALLAHPRVREAAVFPLADERWGQMVCAAVVGDAEAAELEPWLAERLAPYKRPKRIVRVDEIPHSPTGKVRRARLALDLGLDRGPSTRA
ncbi:MAG: AMP-binding protein [Thermodesulfobacteriota bacterium]